MPATSYHRLATMVAAAAIALLPTARSQTINVDLNSSVSNNYSGLGVASGDTGTTWNALTVASSSLTSATIPDGSVKDSQGNTLAGVTVTLANAAGTGINRFDTTANTTPNPTALMRDYTFSGTYNVSVTGLAEGTYEFWYFGHGDQASQIGSVTVNAANGGGGGSTANSSLGRDLINGGAGVSYVYLSSLTVDSGGAFLFTATNYLNGFQLRKTSSGPPPPVDNRKAIFGDAGGTAYTGTAVAPGSGTVWNQLPGNAGTSSYSITNVLDSNGTTLAGATISVTSTDTQVRWFQADTPGNPNPLNLMRDYFYNGTFTIGLTGVPQGNYYLYVFAHGNSTNQNSTVTLNAANGGGTGTTDGVSADNRDLFASGAEGKSYLKFNASVSAAGTLSFVCGPALTSQGYFTGFQLVPYPAPAITSQPPPSPSVTLNSNVNIPVTATGDGTLTYQWRKGGINIANGSTGNGSTISGATTATMSITNAQYADAGNYDVVITNLGGSTTSEISVLTVTATAIAPSITTQPTNQTADTGDSATFSVIANGTSPLSYQWYKGAALLANGITTQGSTISGAETSVLTISGIDVVDAGAYHVVVTNTVNSATSANASLVVTPVILSQPTTVALVTGSNHTASVSATAGSTSPEGITYVWKKDGVAITNGGAYSGATTANLNITGLSTLQSGYYTVTVSNSAGSATTSQVYIGVQSTQSVTFAPGDNATGIAIDQQLRLVFPSPPKLGKLGAITIHDASNGAVVDTIDISQLITYAPGNSTAVIPNAAIRNVQGSSSGTGTATSNYYYTPIAIYGNEAWITPSLRLSYGKTYFVNMDAAVLLDSSNAAHPGISDTSTWSFSTKASGPATPTPSAGPSTITIGLDGSGDFATFQGAFDWIPQNNTLPRKIVVKPGIYRDSATLAQNRNFVTIAGETTNRGDVHLIYPYAYFAPPANIFTAGSLRVESDDVTVRDITLDNIIYYPYSPTGRAENTNVALNGATNTLATTGDRIVFDNVLVKGGQDTIYNNFGIVYFHNSEIWGSVDFIYGKALAVYDQCRIVEIRTTGGPVGAPNTVKAQPHGLVFLDCDFPRALVADGYPYDVNVGSSTFMRPWGQDGAMALIRCSIGSQVSTKGWSEWDGRETTCRVIEYANTGTATPAQRRAAGAFWVNTIDPDYTNNPSLAPTDPLLALPNGPNNRNVLDSTINPDDYTLDAIFGHSYYGLGAWRPALIPRITAQPSAQTVDEGDPVTLTVVATGTPAPTYQWFKDSVEMPGKTNPSLVITSTSATDTAVYTVVVTNSAGSVESSTAQVTVTITDPYSSWAQDQFGANAAVDGAPDVDFDHDGLVNKLEFFLRSDPKSGANGNTLPTAARSTSGPSALVFSFKRAKVAQDLPWSVEFSSELDNAWSTALNGQNGVTIQTTPIDANLDEVIVTIPSIEDRMFARLRLE